MTITTKGSLDLRTLAQDLLKQGLSPFAVAHTVRIYEAMSLEAGLVTVRVLG